MVAPKVLRLGVRHVESLLKATKDDREYSHRGQDHEHDTTCAYCHKGAFWEDLVCLKEEPGEPVLGLGGRVRVCSEGNTLLVPGAG